MINAELAFTHRDIVLAPRRFSIHEGISQLFDVHVTAGSSSPDVDLEAIVGHGAVFRLGMPGAEPSRAVWSGVCSEAEQISVEESGESLYLVRIRPMLWRTTQRRNYRILQHVTAVQAVEQLLADWKLVPELRLEAGQLAKKEYLVQFGESDFAFISRLLEQAGISYRFEPVVPSEQGRERDGKHETMRLVLTDAPGETGHELETPVPFRGQLDDARSAEPWIRNARLGRSLRPGRFTIAGYDYRSSPELRLLVEARTRADLERRYEQFHYDPEAFLEDVSPGDGGRGRVVASERRGKDEARIGLERAKTRQRLLSFETNDLRLAPGVLWSMSGHPRAELGKKAGLMVVERRLEGEVQGEWSIQADACFAHDPFRPPLVTPKPRVMGIQSAIVVGPRGEEIHTDELGRVKVQFHWDRYGQRDEDSSCWIRVSQGWAGSGYGISAIPRVGHEVLVDFLDGDPDQPVIVGRAHNRGAVPPGRLPADKTKTTWKSQSTPGGEGFNEITMDDARGEERLFVRAQKNLDKQVLADETASIGVNLTTVVGGVEQRTVGRDQQIRVRGDRTVDVGGRYAARSDTGLQLQSGELTGVSCVDGKLIISNGSASIVLDGPNVHIDAAANLRVSAGRQLGLYGTEVAIDGGPDVFLNSARAVPPNVQQLPAGTRAGERDDRAERGRSQRVERGGDGMPRRPEGLDEAELERRRRYRDLRDGRELPDRMRLPQPVDEQLERFGRLQRRHRTPLLSPDSYTSVRDRFERRLRGERLRLERLGTDLNRIFEGQRTHIVDLGKRLGSRLEQERVALDKFTSEVSAVFNGERGGFIQSTKALYGAFKEEVSRINQLRKDLIAMLDREKGYLAQFKREWKGYVEQVKGTIEDFKNLIENPKDAILEMFFGEPSSGSGRAPVPPANPPAHQPPVHEPPQHHPPQHPPPGHEPPVHRPPQHPPAHEPGQLKPGTRVPKVRPGSTAEGSRIASRGVDPQAASALRPKSRIDPGKVGGRTAVRPEAAGRLKPEVAMAARPGSGMQQMSGTLDHAPAMNASSDALAHGAAAGLRPGAAESALGPHGSPSPASAALAQPASMSVASTSVAPATGLAAAGSTLESGAAGSHAALQAPGAAATVAGTTAGASGAASSAESAAGGEPIETSGSALSKDGGLAASDVSEALAGEAPIFLQSPSEGTLMIVPTDSAQAIDAGALSQSMVDAQMEGEPVSEHIARSLDAKGWAVYRRPWGDWYGEMVRVGAATV